MEKFLVWLFKLREQMFVCLLFLSVQLYLFVKWARFAAMLNTGSNESDYKTLKPGKVQITVYLMIYFGL